MILLSETESLKIGIKKIVNVINKLHKKKLKFLPLHKFINVGAY